MDTLKQRLARGETVLVFGIGRILHHNLIQIAGVHGGFHGLWFDLEHVGNTIAELEVGCLAARAWGMDTFVRLPPTDYAIVTRSLEAGASGVMAAQIKTAEEAEEVVRWAKFYPRGARGLNAGGFDAKYANMPLAEFCETANKTNLVIIQIETVEAVENVDAIAAIDGVDMLFVGPADLSQNLGVVGDFFNPKCLDAIGKVSAACKKYNKPWGVVPASPEHAQMCVDNGCKMLSPASDVRFINAGVKTVKQQYGKWFGM